LLLLALFCLFGFYLLPFSFSTTFLKIRKPPIKPAIADGSAILTAVLLAISIPSIAPWWIVVVGVSFAIIFGKQLYGGLGNNPFNPAMLGYAFLWV
jgi:electron transport complex protein RnfD